MADDRIPFVAWFFVIEQLKTKLEFIVSEEICDPSTVNGPATCILYPTKVGLSHFMQIIITSYLHGLFQKLQAFANLDLMGVYNVTAEGSHYFSFWPPVLLSEQWQHPGGLCDTKFG